jgi:23S rRNA (guanosine2251-2'-O)-methyltransferase
VTAELVYGRRAVRELLRGPRGVLELHATERALAAEQWLRDEQGLRVRVEPERALTALAGTSDHQGVVARCEPYRYADAHELASAERPLLVCLDQVTDPHNLGAVCRSAEGAGATGVILPSRGSVRVTPAVCRASAGAVEHLPVAVVANLSRFLADARGPALWAYAADVGGAPMWETDLTGGVALVFGAEGKGIRPLVRRTCDGVVSIPLAGKVESLNVSVAAAVLLYETRRQRLGGSPSNSLSRAWA